MIESAGGVGDEIARQHVDARIAAPAARRNRRQLFVILARQAPPNLLNLGPDDVMVVAEPFLGGRFRLLYEPFFRKFFVDLFEPVGVPVKP